ncbi:MAG: hypothetical protein QOI66_1958 [Myxococcales bacterium]|jgi:hypothetical protein|nr:hypothetical protein [Myxococcales bacterium]
MNINLLRYCCIILLCPLACSATAGSVATTDAGAGKDDAGSPISGSGGTTGGGEKPDSSLTGTPPFATAAIAPGLYIVDPATPGAGDCASMTLADVLAAIRAKTALLAAVTTIYNPTQQGTTDGNFIYPYQTADGGFAVAFKRGAGDCPGGCTDNTYDYFQTDDRCAPQQVGHYRAVSGSCLQVEGTPMWGHPAAPPDPSLICGADNTPKNISGIYSFRVQGQRQPCTTTADSLASPNNVDTTITVTLIQSGASLGNGVVIITGTGNALVDAVGLPATFIRSRFEATLQKSNLPSNCPQESSVMARYDFESGLPGTLTMTQLGDSNCSMCKGGLTVSLIQASKN